MKYIFILMILFEIINFPAQAATTIPFTINMSETVNVTGTPRVAIDMGGVTRYATYASGTGTNTLTFNYAATIGDVDLDGVTLISPMELNGGTIRDLSGNDATLAFTVPNTSNVRVNYPSLGMDFVADADGRYTLNSTIYNNLPSFLTATGGSFTRSSIGTYYNSSGVLQTSTANNPRFDYDPITLQPKGILIEESRTNLFTRSSEFDDASWVKSAISISPNVITAPDGTSQADLFIDNVSGAGLGKGADQVKTFNAGQTYTISAFFKTYSSGTIRYPSFLFYNTAFGGYKYAVFNLSTVTVANNNAGITASIKYVGNGWYRCSATATATSNATQSTQIRITSSTADPYANQSGDGISGLYVWGAQLEQGSFATSYIPTVASTVTRQADNFVVMNSGWYNNSEGSIFSEFEIYNLGNANTAYLNSGTSANAFYIAARNSFSSEVVSGTSTQATLNYTVPINTNYKAIMAAKLNDFATDTSNSSLLTDNSGIMPSSINQLHIGSAVGTTYHNGWISKVKYYPIRISNSQLQLMTQ